MSAEIRGGMRIGLSAFGEAASGTTAQLRRNASTIHVHLILMRSSQAVRCTGVVYGFGAL